MWRKLKPWILGSDKESETQHRTDNLGKVLFDDHKDRASSGNIAMVGTRRSQRVSSTVESNPEISPLIKSRPKKGNQKKDEPPSEAIQAGKRGTLEPVTSDTGMVTQFERTDITQAQSLPHRSRSSTQPEDEDRVNELISSNSMVESQEGKQLPSDVTPVEHDNANVEQIDSSTIAISESKAKHEARVLSEQIGKKDAKRKRTRISETPVMGTRPTSISNHKRFGSEESTSQPQILQSQKEGLNASTQSEIVDDESEDDAPEEVTTTVAAQKAKASAAKTAQSIKIQKEADRAKRQKRDRELKTQAQTSKKRKVEPNLSQDSDKTTNLESHLEDDYMDDLPDDLPAEILALEPDLSVNLLDTRSELKKRPNKRKRLDQELKPPKDVHIGNTSVRILSSTNPSLPPPGRRHANNVKEAWLRARMQESKTKVAGYKIRGAGAKSFLCQPSR